ncbi:hypothetical protein RW47_21170 [Acinetobacter baumannii]|nr:hypothetical protein RW47_21170 [Acinetobacter baumannii]
MTLRKSKSNSEFASLISFFTRFARSRFKLSLFAPIRDALYLPFKIERELVIREKAGAKFL